MSVCYFIMSGSFRISYSDMKCRNKLFFINNIISITFYDSNQIDKCNCVWNNSQLHSVTFLYCPPKALSKNFSQ